MENETKETNNMKNYRNIHIGVAILAVGLIVITVIPIQGIVMDIISIAFAVLASEFTSRASKGYEMSEQNIAKSNKITLIALIAAMIVLGVSGDENERVNLSANVFWIIAAGAIALRSILFLWFDRTPKEEQ